jgi:hypothetical protein
VGNWTETAHPGDNNIEAALAPADNLALDRFARGHRFVELFLELRLEGQPSRNPNLLPGGNHHDLDRIAGTEIIDLGSVEHRFRLSRDVNQRNIAFNRDDRSLDDVAYLEGFGFKTLAQRLFKLIHNVGFFGHGRPRTQTFRTWCAREAEE